MGMLEELLRQLQEAAEQQRTQPLPGIPRPAQAPRPPSVPSSVPRTEEMRREAIQRQRQGTRKQPPTMVVEAPPVEIGEDPVRRLVADSIPAVVESSRRREHPLMARLRQQGGMRDAVVLAEILRRPGRR